MCRTGGRDLRVFLTCGFNSTGESADAACRKSVGFIAVEGDSCREWERTPRPGFGEKIAEAVMLMGGDGEPRARLSIIGESKAGDDPLGLGENIADAVISTGDPSAENEREPFPDVPLQGERGNNIEEGN